MRDAVAPGEYKVEEDPRLYRSAKTGRGPLADDWASKAAQTGPLMCAYKLCKVEFRYWGMQAKIEQFIHDVGEHLQAGVRVGARPRRLPIHLAPEANTHHCAEPNQRAESCRIRQQEADHRVSPPHSAQAGGYRVQALMSFIY